MRGKLAALLATLVTVATSCGSSSPHRAAPSPAQASSPGQGGVAAPASPLSPPSPQAALSSPPPSVAPATPQAQAQAAQQQPTSCPTSRLSLSIYWPPEGAGGNIHYGVILRNAGPVPCTLQGFPGVSLLDAQHRQMGQPAMRGGDPGRLLLLGPGQPANATLGVSSTCGSDPRALPVSSYIRVYPPGNTAGLEMKFTAEECNVNISSLVPGAKPAA